MSTPYADEPRRTRLVAMVAASALVGTFGLASAASASPTPEPTASATTTDDTSHDNPQFEAPESVDTYVGQSVQSRRTADGVPNSDIVNYRWTVTQVNAESLNGLDVAVPLPMDDAPHLRSLTGSDNMATEVDGGVVYEFDDVNGNATKRTLNLWPQDRNLPVDISTKFTLDGEQVDAADIIGKGGLVTATYTIHNLTVADTSVNFKDLKGEDAVQTVPTSLGMVGISKQFIPQSWAQFDAGHGGIYGADGRGNYQTQWITLAFLPFAENGEASFGWSAVIPDGQGFIPKMVMEISPLYVPAHAPGEEEPAAAEDDNGVPKPNLDPATSMIHAGVEDLINGVSGIADLLPEKDPNAPPLTEKLGNLESGLSNASAALGDGIDALKGMIDNANAGGVPVTPEQVEALIKAVNGVIKSMNKQIADITEAQASCPDKPTGQEKVICDALATALKTLTANVAVLEDEILPALNQLLEYATAGTPEITTGALQAILDKFTAAKSTVDGLQGKISTLLSTIATAGDLASLAASGKTQISAGIGEASVEVQAYIANVVAVAQAAAASGKDAAAEVEKAANTIKAEMAGLKMRLADSPLPYGGGFNTVYAPAGDPEAVQAQAVSLINEPNAVPEKDGIVATSSLFGAYQFMLDPADSNHSNTPWRVLFAFVLVIGAGLIGKRLAASHS